MVYHRRTCVGLRYGNHVLLNEIFLESRTICVALALQLELLFASELKRNSGLAYYHYVKA